MKLNFKNLPVANLPYEDIKLCKHMMLRLYEKIPFLAELPNISPTDNIIYRTAVNIPGITYKDRKLLIEDNSNSAFYKAASDLDKAYNDYSLSRIEEFNIGSPPFWEIYKEMIKRIQPEHTIIRLLGPFSFAEAIFNVSTINLIRERTYRKYIIQALAMKALWFLNQIEELSPKTKVIFLFEEHQLYKFGSIKRTNDDITKETIITLFTKLFQRIQKSGGLVGVESFEKCNWQLVLDSNVNMISFDAYNNPSSLNIVSERLGSFLAKGGYINWAIVPAANEKIVRGLNLDLAYKIFTKAIEDLSAQGVSLDLLYKNLTISVQSNLSNLPILFAEKALMIESQLAKKIPASSRQ